MVFFVACAVCVCHRESIRDLERGSQKCDGAQDTKAFLADRKTRPKRHLLYPDSKK